MASHFLLRSDHEEDEVGGEVKRVEGFLDTRSARFLVGLEFLELSDSSRSLVNGKEGGLVVLLAESSTRSCTSLDTLSSIANRAEGVGVGPPSWEVHLVCEEDSLSASEGVTDVTEDKDDRPVVVGEVPTTDESEDERESGDPATLSTLEFEIDTVPVMVSTDEEPRPPITSIRPRPCTPSRMTPTTSPAAGANLADLVSLGSVELDKMSGEEGAGTSLPVVADRFAIRSHLRLRVASSASWATSCSRNSRHLDSF